MEKQSGGTATSFVVTVFNKLPFLSHVLDAIVGECRDVGGEIIVVDDGSTDGSIAFLERYAAQEKSIRLILQANQGPPGATTTGMRAAQMPFLRLIDGDDILVRGSTRLMLEALERSAAQFVGGTKELYRLDTLDPSQLRPVDRTHPARFEVMANPIRATIRNNEIVPSLMLMTRAVAEHVLPIPAVSRTNHDFHIVVRAATLTRIVKLHATVCYFAAAAEGRISSSVSGMYYHTVLTCREHMSGPWAWSAADRRYALRRNAGRALLYARRHLPFDPLRWSGLFLVQLLGYLPFYRWYPAAFDYVASTYLPVLRGSPARIEAKATV
jgi:glycosyltransferase involved in cell wall biosynthesis